MQYEQVHSFLIQKLENGLPSYLTYHDTGHTKNVIETAEHLAMAENISGDDLVLLKTAALFHDAGYMQIYKGHKISPAKWPKNTCLIMGIALIRLKQYVG